MNRVELFASIAQLEPMRHTPAGVPVLGLRLQHESQVIEADMPRMVALEMQALAMGDMAGRLAGLEAGSHARFAGFLAPARMGSDRLILHIQQFTQAH